MFDFIDNIIQSKPEDWNFQVGDGKALIIARLEAETTIRIYVDNSDNFGNQASSVLVMQTLIDDYGFQGAGKTVWMVYKTENSDKTREKLSLLIKGFNAADPAATAVYNGTAINFTTIDNLADEQINYGFSGAGNPDPDHSDISNYFAVQLKTKVFLLLQPYLWDLDGPDEIEYGAPYQENAAYKLASADGAGEDFSSRGWYIKEEYWTPTADDWAYYSNPDSPGVDQGLAARVTLAQVLTQFVKDPTKNVKFLPAYGIKGVSEPVDGTDPPYYQNQMLLPPDQVLPTVVSTALGGSALDNATPAIVVSMNTNMDDISYLSSYQVSTGGATRSEESAQQSFDTATANKEQAETALLEAQQASKDTGLLQETLDEATSALATQSINNNDQKQAKTTRVDWLTERNAVEGVTFLSSIVRPSPGGGMTPAVTPGTLSAALTHLVSPGASTPAVLYLELGSLPKVIFSYVMWLATLPNVFEGANSAILALNQGKSYLRMKDVTWDQPGNEDPKDLGRYPSAWAPGADAYDPVHMQSIAAADGVTDALLSSPTEPAANFLPNVTATTKYLRDSCITPEESLTAYYAAIKGYYHNSVNGKLEIGLSYLNQAAINIGIPPPE